MFTKTTISIVSVILAVSVMLWATGVAKAVEASISLPAKSPAPLTPLTDDDMGKIQGGGFWLIAGVIIAAITLGCVIYETFVKKNEPQIAQPYQSMTGGTQCIQVNGNVTVNIYVIQQGQQCPSTQPNIPEIDNVKVGGPDPEKCCQ